MKALAELAAGVEGAHWLRPPAPGARVSQLIADSRQAAPGALFVAIPGSRVDGHDHVAEAVARGASAVVVERAVAGVAVPMLQVPDARRALATLAAAWYGHPAERLPLVGITGTLGKTSVLSMVEAILARAGQRVGSIGSLGIHFGGEVENTGHTVPGPLVVQEALAGMAAAGADLVVMEVTSHALAQGRVQGLEFDLGIFTNLVPLEHMEYHGSFEEYVAAKSRYFDHLPPGTPVVHSTGDRAVTALLAERDVQPIGCGRGAEATVRIERQRADAEGTSLVLHVRSPLPRRGREPFPARSIPLRLRLLGRPNENNATLAATAALCLGAPAEAVQAALAEVAAPPRRMQVTHRGRFSVLDDTVGHPDSITAVFEAAAALPHRRLHVAFAIRGARGAEINRGDADALAIWTARVPVATLVVTTSQDAADERNRVAPEERAAFLSRLRGADVEFEERSRLRDAVEHVLGQAGDGDLVLLLGAQGMDAGAALARRWLQAAEPGVPSAARLARDAPPAASA